MGTDYTGWRTRLVAGVAGLAFCAAVGATGQDSWWTGIQQDKASVVKTLLAQGADPNAVSEAGQPAIMQAIRDGSWDVYDLLLAHRNINLNATNAAGETPLMYLAILGDTRRAQALIKRGANVNRLGWTPLHYAASKGHADTVRMLIANKAIVNAPAPDGTTALMMAAYAGSQDVVDALLESGADVTMQNLQKQDAADWARRRNQDKLAARLDTLIAQKLAARSSRQSGESEPKPSMPHTAQPAPSPAPQKQDGSTADKQGSSRYFDLDRFEKESSN